MAPAALYFKVPTKKNINLWENTDLLAIQTTEKTEKKMAFLIFGGFFVVLLGVFFVVFFF